MKGPHESLHALASPDRELIRGLKPDQAGARELDVENDIGNDYRDDSRAEAPDLLPASDANFCNQLVPAC